MTNTSYCATYATIRSMKTSKNPSLAQPKHCTETRLENLSVQRSGRRRKAYYCFAARYTFPRLVICAVELSKRTTIRESLVIQADGKRSNSSHETSGGRKCPDTLGCIAEPAICAIGRNPVDINLSANCRQQKPRMHDGNESVWTSLSNSPKPMAMTRS